MKKIILLTVAVAMFIALPLSSVFAVEVFSASTELRQWDPEKSYNGYVLFAPMGWDMTYLIDMEGNVVHTWVGASSNPKLLEDGSLWSNGRLQDWDGNILWQFETKTDVNGNTIGQHHDGWRIWNKKLNAYTYLMCARLTTTEEEILAAGGDPSKEYGDISRGDGIIEVDQNNNLIWMWRFIDHACQSRNPAWQNYVADVGLAPGKSDIFWKTNQSEPFGDEGIVRDWQHINSLDYNEDLDQIAVNAKHWSEFYVIDHGVTFVSTTDWSANIAEAAGPNGDYIYRWGNPSAYNQGLAPDFQNNGEQQMFGAHNIQWIKEYHWNSPHQEAGDTWPDPATVFAETMTGAGNFLIYDNGCYRPLGYRSNVIEINPFLNADGVSQYPNYVNPPDAGYSEPSGSAGAGTLSTGVSKQVVWSYHSTLANSFYSFYISGCQRLPNGNTSINCGNTGHMFEVTPDGEVVWEYINPVSARGKDPASRGIKEIMTDSDRQNSSVFRHYRYGADYPGLAGKVLTSTGTITGRLPGGVGIGDQYPEVVPITGWGIPPGTTSEAGGAGGGATGGGGMGY